MQSLISVIVPVFNGETYLHRCINSLLDQTYSHLEIILVDDGSTDNSPSICHWFADNYVNIKVIHKNNEGPGAARKSGYEIAEGNYIAFVDADDFIEKSMYETMMKVALEKQADIVQCGYIRIKENGEVIEKRKMQEEIIVGPYQCAQFYVRQKNVTNHLWNKLFKKTLFFNLEFPALSAGEDACVLCQLFSNANRVITINEALYNYVMTEESLCRKPFSLQRLDSVKAGEFMYNFYKKRFPDLAEYSSLYICSHAAQCYCYMSYSNIPNKSHIMDELKKTFNKYFKINNPVWRDVSAKRKYLIILFKLSPTLCVLLFRHIVTTQTTH